MENSQTHPADVTFKKLKIPTPIRVDVEVDKFIETVCSLGGFIAGGYANKILTRGSRGVRIRYMAGADIDIFCRNKEAFDKIEVYLDSLNRGKVHTKYTVTYKYRNSYDLDIQLIKPVELEGRNLYGTPEEVLGEFDFTVCRAALVSSDEAIVDSRWEEDEKNSVLRVVKARQGPLGLALRLVKYMRKGYKPELKDVFPVLFDNGLEPAVVYHMLRLVIQYHGRDFFGDVLKRAYDDFITGQINIKSPYDFQREFDRILSEHEEAAV